MHVGRQCRWVREALKETTTKGLMSSTLLSRPALAPLWKVTIHSASC